MANSSNTTTSSWVLFTWVCFIVAILSMAFAVIYMPMDNWLRAYLGLSGLFLIQSSISLSKTLRDQAEHQEPNE
ncbi:YiaA/YiaB family inner membrane protein [Commensalibacter oyaizuii]|uniref:YiaA/YiaB family inner membrane protein n=1 Tax=Commensalibacter oyaizuii TaxID=3043873 RepID=A0ABT6Q279_9PROT|nr:YiaA/YiaB family inner membrane protein [Commensalibacter sp. TBRC 16381]MDI2091228.1 YiaA/YiaB family inner membrane protein [Commensalibacter sp. TBRC 16381]